MLEDRPYMREPEWRPEADRRRMSLCLTLIFINVVIFLVQAIIAVYGSKEMRLVIQDYFCLSAEGLTHGYLWQVFTYQFMHAAPSPWHLLFNMIGLFFIGRAIEEAYGWRVLLRVYLLSGVLGGLLQAGLVAAGWCMDLPMVGASASVFGLLAVFTRAFPERQLTLLIFFVLPVNVRAGTIFWVALIWSIFGVVFLRIPPDLAPGEFTHGEAVAHGGHLGGMLAGWLMVGWIVAGDFSFSGVMERLRSGRQRSRKVMKAGGTRAYSSEQRDVYENAEGSSEDFMQQEIDPILEKISRQGIHSLTKREREILEEARKRMR
jgi:membrane associated rhomboid family serine protease